MYPYGSNLFNENSLGSKVQVIDDSGPVFTAEWTGPEIIAVQRGNSEMNVGATALAMSDIVFSGIMVLGLGLGGALIHRLIKRV